MDLEPDADQTLLIEALHAMGRRWSEPPAGHERDYAVFAAELEAELRDGGFLRAGLDIGMLEAALVVLESARLPVVTTAGASALVAPKLLGEVLDGPVAIVSGRLDGAHRLLPVARYALVESEGEVRLLDMSGVAVEATPSIYAYPYGRFAGPVDLSAARRLDDGASAILQQWRRVALAAECAGAAASAVALTVEHVKERRVFGKPIGAFQAVQHRLAQCHQIAQGLRLLALHAAWSGESASADAAAVYAQDHVNKLAFDLHQFSGGMGVTCEYKLHFWTYRLRALQAEAGGADAAAMSLHGRLWGEAAQA